VLCTLTLYLFLCSINFFDCAEGYAKGESEKVMGRAIKHFNWNRNDIVVSTKVLHAVVELDHRTVLTGVDLLGYP